MPRRPKSTSDVMECLGFNQEEFSTFIKEHEHLNAWLEYLENAPDVEGQLLKKGGLLAEQIGHFGLKALQDGEAKYVVQQRKSSKADWTLGDHELRYVVRVVQWCRAPGGRWSSEPLEENHCERVIYLLRLLRSETRPNRGPTSTLRKVIDEGLDEKRWAERRAAEMPGPDLATPFSDLSTSHASPDLANQSRQEALNTQGEDASSRPVQENDNSNAQTLGSGSGSSAASNPSQFVLQEEILDKLFKFQQDLSIELSEIRWINGTRLDKGVQYHLSRDKFPLLQNLQQRLPALEEVLRQQERGQRE